MWISVKRNTPGMSRGSLVNYLLFHSDEAPNNKAPVAHPAKRCQHWASPALPHLDLLAQNRSYDVLMKDYRQGMLERLMVIYYPRN